MQINRIFILLLLLSSLFIGGCQHWTNFITYFNTYYNMERIIKESEDEFSWQDEKKRILPRVLVPQPEFYIPHDHVTGVPPFMQEFIITQQQRQPVRVKLDSVITKGSKILAKRPTSSYIEGSLFLMGKTYFYKEEWIPAQIKFSELIDNFPKGKKSPDAHLMLAKSLLIQRKFFAGEAMLSRTVDVAWLLKRYDILSEAFRLEAELALYQNDIEKAQRPYRQAIAQTSNRKLKAQWQVDLAALLYRAGEFERAEIEFAKTREYRPDYLATYESYLYQASSLNRLGRYEEALKILDMLARDRKYEEWLAYTEVERLNGERLAANDKNTKGAVASLVPREREVDKEYTNNPLLAVYYFERGLDDFTRNSWLDARTYFSKARVIRTPVSVTAGKYFDLLNTWDTRQKQIKHAQTENEDLFAANDSTRLHLAGAYFEIGRVHEQLEFQDSAFYYFQQSAQITPETNDESARYYYAYSRVLKPNDAYQADSLLEVIATKYPFTDYGQDAMRQLGFTESFIIDTVAELFNSGYNLMRYEDYPYSISQFTRVYDEYPESDYAPRSLYSIGWIFEKKRINFDSAFHYYSILIDRYPDSKYAQDVQLSIIYLLALQSGEPLPDSLQRRLKPVEPTPVKGLPQGEDQIILPPGRRQSMPEGEMDPRTLMRDPKQLLQSGKELLLDPVQSIKDFQIPTKDDLLQNPFAKPDTTETEPEMSPDEPIIDSDNNEKDDENEIIEEKKQEEKKQEEKTDKKPEEENKEKTKKDKE